MDLDAVKSEMFRGHRSLTRSEILVGGLPGFLMGMIKVVKYIQCNHSCRKRCTRARCPRLSFIYLFILFSAETPDFGPNLEFQQKWSEIFRGYFGSDPCPSRNEMKLVTLWPIMFFFFLHKSESNCFGLISNKSLCKVFLGRDGAQNCLGGSCHVVY